MILTYNFSIKKFYTRVVGVSKKCFYALYEKFRNVVDNVHTSILNIISYVSSVFTNLLSFFAEIFASYLNFFSFVLALLLAYHTLLTQVFPLLCALHCQMYDFFDIIRVTFISMYLGICIIFTLIKDTILFAHVLILHIFSSCWIIYQLVLDYIYHIINVLFGVNFLIDKYHYFLDNYSFFRALSHAVFVFYYTFNFILPEIFTEIRSIIWSMFASGYLAVNYIHIHLIEMHPGMKFNNSVAAVFDNLYQQRSFLLYYTDNTVVSFSTGIYNFFIEIMCIMYLFFEYIYALIVYTFKCNILPFYVLFSNALDFLQLSAVKPAYAFINKLFIIQGNQPVSPILMPTIFEKYNLISVIFFFNIFSLVLSVSFFTKVVHVFIFIGYILIFFLIFGYNQYIGFFFLVEVATVIFILSLLCEFRLTLRNMNKHLFFKKLLFLITILLVFLLFFFFFNLFNYREFNFYSFSHKNVRNSLEAVSLFLYKYSFIYSFCVSVSFIVLTYCIIYLLKDFFIKYLNSFYDKYISKSKSFSYIKNIVIEYELEKQPKTDIFYDIMNPKSYPAPFFKRKRFWYKKFWY